MLEILGSNIPESGQNLVGNLEDFQSSDVGSFNHFGGIENR
jgi:hypothetical protein